MLMKIQRRSLDFLIARIVDGVGGPEDFSGHRIRQLAAHAYTDRFVRVVVCEVCKENTVGTILGTDLGKQAGWKRIRGRQCAPARHLL